MQQFKELNPQELGDNPFRLIGKDWMLISAQHEGVANTMTASWGGLGVLWHRPVATVYIRPQRFTSGLVNAAPTFSLCFFDESQRENLTYCGRVSGRDEDKFARCGFDVLEVEGAPVFAQARLALVCKKLYTHDIDPARFLEESIDQNYPNKDYHRMFIGEILRVLVK